MKIYTDGSSKGNPGPGGFGVVVCDDKDNIIYTYSKMSEKETTNNEQEMLAVIFAAARYGHNIPPPQVYCDSAYVVNSFNTWIFNWVANDWKKSNNKPPENLDLIKFYYSLIKSGFKIDLIKIKGHSGNKYNELADKLAKGEEIEKEKY